MNVDRALCHRDIAARISAISLSLGKTRPGFFISSSRIENSVAERSTISFSS